MRGRLRARYDYAIASFSPTRGLSYTTRFFFFHLLLLLLPFIFVSVSSHTQHTLSLSLSHSIIVDDIYIYIYFLRTLRGRDLRQTSQYACSRLFSLFIFIIIIIVYKIHVRACGLDGVFAPTHSPVAWRGGVPYDGRTDISSSSSSYNTPPHHAHVATCRPVYITPPSLWCVRRPTKSYRRPAKSYRRPKPTAAAAATAWQMSFILPRQIYIFLLLVVGTWTQSELPSHLRNYRDSLHHPSHT